MSAVEERLVFDAIAERARTEPLRNWRRFGYLIRFLLDTGCRKGEALTMLNDDRHLMTQYVERLKRHQTLAVFYKTKNGKFRSIPLSTEICESLFWLKDNAVEGKFFPYAPGSVNYMWSNIRKDVKSASGTDIKDVTLHTLRHTCISRKAQRQGSKGDIHKISLWPGHSNIAVTVKRYAHLMPQDMIDLL